MSHIPYYGEDDAERVVVKSNNKTFLTATVVAALSFMSQFGYAQDIKPEKVDYKNHVEEIVVRAMDLSDMSIKNGMISVGLTNEVLVHLYDSKTDSWKFVGTKKHKKDK